MKKIKMLSALAFSNNTTFQPKQIVEVEDNVANRLVEKNLAIFIEEKVEKVEEKDDKEQLVQKEKPKTPKKARKKKAEV